MLPLRPWKPKPHAKLGAGATVVEEVSHFIHEMGNRLMILMARMEIRALNRKDRAVIVLEKKRVMKNRRAVLRRRRLAMGRI